MIRMPLPDMIRHISEKSGLSETEVSTRIDEKCGQLAGLISKDGAAHIVANELGLQLIAAAGRLKIKDILPGMRGIEVAGKVVQKFEQREFSRQDGSTGRMMAGTLADETGSVRLVAWGSKAEQLGQVPDGSVVLIQQAQVRESNRGGKELHLGDQASIAANPAGVQIGEVTATFDKPTRKRINELGEADQNVELVGTIIQVFDPKFFEVCPNCNKRAKLDENNTAMCPQHGPVTPAWSIVSNAYIEDGSGDIRVVFFRSQLERLTKMSTEQLLAYREQPERFEDVKRELLGNMIKVVGRANKNKFFDRLEFVAQLVRDADPQEEIARLQAA
jgi:replication factor A1